MVSLPAQIRSDCWMHY